MTRIVLGSASTGRLSVLRNAGVEPLVVVSGVDEEAVTAAYPDVTPVQLVCALARARADGAVNLLEADVAADCVVIGCDSMLLVDGRLSGKPLTPDRARVQWIAMAGRSGQLLTGHDVIRMRDGRITHRVSETASTIVYFGSPTAEIIDVYIASGEPLNVAGGFTLDGRGGWFVERIDGDPPNVIGLSLPLTHRLFARIGLSLAALWSTGARGDLTADSP